MSLHLSEVGAQEEGHKPLLRRASVHRSMNDAYCERSLANAGVTRARLLAVFRRTLMRGQGARRRS